MTVTVGVHGCSNTRNAVSGYHNVSQAGKLWDDRDLRNYKGKAISEWSNPACAGWPVFDANLSKYPATDQIWWQLCVHQSGSSQAQAQAVLDLIRTRTQLPVVASPLDSTPICERGPSGSFVDALVASGQVLRGPVMTPLDASQVVADGCHANAAGMLIWGADLSAFFDGG